MDDKKLDINQPLLTVRRLSSALNSEKDVLNSDNYRPLPRLPVRNPGRVPFVWEESPGRPKTDNISQSQALKKVPNIPKLPPGKTAIRKCREKFPSISECASSLERDSEVCEEESYSSKEGGEAYLDAINTLSRPLDGRSSRFSTDSKTRDFMMGRFLPADKDLALEKPRYVSRQHPSNSRKVIDTAINADKMPQVRCPKGNDILPNYVEYCKKDEEIEDEGDETGHGICGLLPKSCLLNPIPAMVPASYVRKSRARSSSSCSLEEMKHGFKRPAILEASRYDKNKLEYETTTGNKNGNPLQQLRKTSSQRIHGGAETDEFSCLISLERSSNSYQRFLASQNALGSTRHVLEKSLKLKSVSASVSNVNELEETPSSGSSSNCIEGSGVVNEGVASKSFSGKLIRDCVENSDVEDRKELTKVGNDVKFPLPPLPKSPSESWLSRTLPSVSSRHRASCSYIGAKMNYPYQASSYANR